MRRGLAGPNAELAEAIRTVNVLYAQIPEARRPEVTGEQWQTLEAEIDAACVAGDRQRALRAIGAWREHAEQVFAGLVATGVEVSG